jgi:RNA polymerase sigma factor (sigma-70 family)
MSLVSGIGMASPFEQLPEDRFGDLVRQVRPRLKTLLARYRIPLQDTEDLLQQTLLQLAFQWDRIRDREAWLMGTLKRQCLMYWRDQRRRLYSAVDSALLELMSQPVAPEQERAELLRDLQSLIDRLPPRCRSLLALRFRLGYEPSEVAERMGYSTASIGKITSRCLAALHRELLAGSPGDGSLAGCSGCLAAADGDALGRPRNAS